ncbi:MAG: acyl--CoA ligase [Pseudomonadota bacterium]|nr:acyl--CoA ligase [Pseudomonadota bacterium]
MSARPFLGARRGKFGAREASPRAPSAPPPCQVSPPRVSTAANQTPEEALPYPALSLAETHRRLTAPGAPFEMVEAEIRGERQRVWKHAPPTLREVFLLGRSFGERTFLVHEGERATFEAFARASVCFARELQAMGLTKGDRVAIAMRNLPEWPVAFFGAILIGAIAVPINAWSTGPEMQYVLKDSGARVAVADAERFERLKPLVADCPDLRVVLVSRATALLDHPQAESWERLIGGAADWAGLPAFDMPSVELAPDDDATIFYTSGTTGKPKGALGTHRNVCSTLFARPYGMAAASLRRGEAPAAPDPQAAQKSALLSVPYFHVTGCMSTLIPMLAAGMKLVTMRRWDVVEALKVIERERVNGVGGVPTIAWQLIEHPDFAKYDTSSLEGFSYGGAPAAADLVRRLKLAAPASQLATAWGMTETSAPFTIVLGEDYETHPLTCGYALPVGDMRIVDANGRDLPVGEAGELWVRGPMVVKGYWNQPEATEQTFGGGWLRTGDIARLDEEGFCYIVDRAKDMLIRGGENIYCVEVENALAAHPDVVDAAVVGRPHRELGEEPVAVVTLKPGSTLTEAALRAFAAERIAGFKVPVRVIVRQEMLPRNANGKILKRDLRQLFVG